MSLVVAFPSTAPGGLEADLSAHFGHCDMFTVIDMDGGEMKEIKVLPNMPHEQGGCLAPVNFLASNGVKALVAGGMGMRPLMGFNQAGIEVFFNAGMAKVKDAATAFAEGRLPRFGQENTCGGHAPGGCGNH